MYDEAIIEQIIEDAKYIVAHNKKKYDKIMKIIEDFISKNDIIIKEIKEYFFDLFTNDMFNLPTELTKLIYNTDPVIAKYVTLDIKIYKYHSRISIDGIQMVYFTYINPEIRNNILDYTCSGVYTKKQLKCFGPEIILINLYADLVNPAFYKDWPTIFDTECKLSSEIVKTFTERIGSGRTIKSTMVDQMYTYYTSHNTRQELTVYNTRNNTTLLDNFICDNHVIIGKYAYNLYLKESNIGRLQIITTRSFNEEISILKKLLPSITYNISNLKIPTNLNLHKMTVYLNNEIIVDIFDSGTYELVPYNKKRVNFGSPFVVLRFYLIDIWQLLFSIKNGNLAKTQGFSIINRIINDYISLRSKIHTIDINILFSDTYIGYYEDIALTKLRIAARLKIKYIPPYMPLLDKKI